MKEITIKVSRFDPAADTEPHFEEYTVRVNEGARVLHALHAVRDEHDPTLAYRYCCGSGQCRTCAVRVDGKPVLACMEEARDGMTVEPLALPVLKDLTVDLEPVIAKIARICPAPDAGLPAREEIEAIKPLRDCIECLCCVSACPALQVTDFAGPTVLRQEMRLALDPRDSGDRITDAIEKGLFYCTTCKRCVEVCPKKIDTPGDREPPRADPTPPPGGGAAGAGNRPERRADAADLPRTGAGGYRARRPRPRRGGVLRRVHVQRPGAADGARRDGGHEAQRHPGDHPPRAGLLRLAADPDGTDIVH